MSVGTAATLAERVAEHIRAEIFAQHLKPGDALPGEIEIAARLGVSRGIVREGRRQLVAAGLIEVSNGRRARVSRMDDAPILGFMTNALATRQIGVPEVLEFRRTLEIGVAGQAALRRGAVDLARLDDIVRTLRAAVNSRKRYIDADMAFHRALALAAGNPLYVLLLDAIRTPMRASMRASEAHRHGRRAISEGHRLHEAIHDAVARGDCAGAEEAMREHFAEIADVMQEGQAA